ncbi:MAG: hypothetical protein QM729_10835 [Solirubrobacterales bacterium]
MHRKRGTRTRRAVPRLASALLCIFLLAAAPAGAAKTHVFLETFGSAAHPTLYKARGMAVDQQTGELYVIDVKAQALYRFDEDGTPSDFSALGTNVIEGFDFRSEPGVPTEGEVAIDESGTATDGDIYVTQPLTHDVEIFNSAGERIGTLTGNSEETYEEASSAEYSTPCGVAVDAAGRVFVSIGGPLEGAESRIYEYTPTANPPANADAGESVATEVPNTCDLAVGTGANAGLLFSAFSETGRWGAAAIDPETGAAEIFMEETHAVNAIALDPETGHVYTGSAGEGAFPRRIREWSFAEGSATEISEYLPSEISTGISASNAVGIAVDGATGKVYISGGSEEHGSETEVGVLSPLVTVPDVEAEAAAISGETSAVLRGTVNPWGVELSECFFEYGTSTAYGQTAPCEEPDAAEVGGGEEAVAVHADVSGLGAETRYHYRLVAANAESGKQIYSSDETLKTPSEPAIEAEWAASVGAAGATLSASINPENAPTTYLVEWGADSGYGNATAEAEVGEDATGHTVSVTLEGLTPGATYHYRFLAFNRLGEAVGGDKEFTTFRTPAADTSCPNQALRTGAASALPDCRAYEMVSHAVHEGADILQMINISSDPAALDQAASEGDALTYSTYHAAEGAVSAPYTSQYIARRGTAGWEADPISPERGTPLNPIPFLDVEFRAFSADLCQAWLLHDPDTNLLAAGAIEGYANLYRRTDCGTTEYETVTAAEVAPQEGDGDFYPDLEGVAEEGDLAVFRVKDKLIEEATAARYQVYGYSEGALRLICVLPSGVRFVGNCTVGTANSAVGLRTSSVQNAVAADGSRVYWTAGETETETVPSGPGTIYLRINPGKAQSKVSGGTCTQATKACTLPVSGTVSSSKARFWGAARNGEEALFEVEEGELKGNLYEYDAESRESTLVAGEVLGVLGGGEDLGRVYLVSEEALASGATEGEPNLYLYEAADQSFRFIAALSEEDVSQAQEEPTPVNHQPILHAAQASTDGEQLTFMSTASPTGYDNTDQATDEADAEVYLYDATAAEGEGELVCASCNPTGARPTGRVLEFEGKQNGEWPVAAHIATAESQLYAPKALTDGGKRLFFMSFEALVPGDENGEQDVYEWEEPGTGTCTTEANDYVAADGGCIYLISSGQASEGATFLDADEDGGEVFFTTAQSLVTEDKGLIDIYDARVDGGFAAAEEAAECEGSSCQGAATAPGSESPGSSAAQATGNVTATKVKSCGKGKRRVRRHGKVRCVKKSSSKHHKKSKKKSHKNKGKGR